MSERVEAKGYAVVGPERAICWTHQLPKGQPRLFLAGDSAVYLMAQRHLLDEASGPGHTVRPVTITTENVDALRQRVAELEAVVRQWEDDGEHHLKMLDRVGELEAELGEWQRSARAEAEEHNETLRRVAELESEYAVAIEQIDWWGGYASEYFQRKHDLSGCVERHKKILSREDDSDGR